MAVDPCSVCGSKDLNLIDGYYYCVECGTQDTNVRETVIEQQFFADGTFAQSTKKKILVRDEKIQMTGEWYKWHTFNFILNGLADELIALGAAPSFKTKLLWIWTKYIKEYQKKEDIGLSQLNETEASLTQLTQESTIEAPHDDDTENDVSVSKKKTKSQTIKSSEDISLVTSGLLITMLYAALNLDKSDIQISHLFRFIEEDRLNVKNFDRHIPQDVNVKSIPNWQQFVKSHGHMTTFGPVRCRVRAITLLKKLDLGPPVLPDMRKIIDNYVTELCLPNEFKNLVFSLMYLWPCDFLDVDSRTLKTIAKFPDYEATAMAYILVALKMCFGLDDNYEYRLSDVVDKYNEMEKFSKCYKIGFVPEPTGRLFSFRDWISYLQFRRKILIKNRIIPTKEEHYMDVDDYIYMEYLKERPKGKVTMTDELSMDIVNKLHLEKDIDVIPKAYFPHSLTPLTTNIEVLSHNCRNVNDVELLSEDFSQYSLKYACENLKLSALENNDNIIVGINNQGKTVTNGEIMCSYVKSLKTSKQVEMVYIKNCQNKNWLTTNKPTIEHVITDTNDNNTKVEDDSDHGYDSNLPSTPSDKDVVIEQQYTENDKVLETIREEDEHLNIFDDTFEVNDTPKEINSEENGFLDNVDNNTVPDANFEQSDEEDRKSVASTESFKFNPETFNRERVIKELILNACKKYKIPIPKEYRTTEVRKRKREYFDDAGDSQRKYAKTAKRGEVKQKIQKLLETYYSHLEKDFFSRTSQQLSILIHNMNQTKQEDVTHDYGENLNNSEPNYSSAIHGYSNVSEISAIAPEFSQVNISKLNNEEDNIEPSLFNEDSDCENIEDLTIINDPKYDPATHEVNQLYIKIDEDDAEPEDIYESLRDPEIDKIIEEKMEECKHREITVKAKHRVVESSDSEDEIPLSVIRLEKVAYSEEVSENFSPLIINNDIPEFKYWVKRYDTLYMSRERNVREKFESEISETMPTTFSFLLRECFIVSGCTPFNIYKSLQNLERNLVFCAREEIKNNVKY